MPNDIAPRASVATMAPNPTPPPLTVTHTGNGTRDSAPVPPPVDSAAEGAPKRRQRRTSAVQAAPAAPVAPTVSTSSSGCSPLSDEELQDLGALQVLAARAGVSVDDYIEDARRLCVSYDRFRAYVAARKAGV